MEWSGGGPRYDFVKFSDEPVMQNQMKAFGSIMQHIDQPLDGTIIRIPLRTESRAAKSEISSRPTTTSELADVLRTFALEFSDSGLLFLKIVEKLSVELDGESYVIEMMDRDKIREHKSKINDAVEAALRDSSYTFNSSFETSINYAYPGGSKTNTFVVQHRIDSAGMDETLRKWSEEQKFTPWVAVAAQIPSQTSRYTTGVVIYRLTAANTHRSTCPNSCLIQPLSRPSKASTRRYYKPG